MNTKICPYCHEEISEDAILCKFCHNLLTDDDEDNTPAAEQEDSEERTRVFSKAEAAKATDEQ